MHLSPFEFQRPLRPFEVLGRDDEIDQIVATAAAGRALTVVAPRRYGKTSVLGAAAVRLHELGHTVVSVDLYGTSSVAELVVRLERAWAATHGHLRAAAGRVLDVAGIGLSLSGAGFSATLARRPDTNPIPALHSLMDLPRRVGTADRHVVVMFDEFQALGPLDGVEALLRSHVQHHTDVASYVFAGSEPHLLNAQFDDPDRPFYGQSLRMRLGRPARSAFVTTISDGFSTTDRRPGDALGPLLDLSEGHPQRTMMLAHFLWEHTEEGTAAGLQVWEMARAAAREHARGEVQALFDTATTNQRRMLRILAADASPYDGLLLRRVGMDSGSVAATVRQLVRDGFVETDAGRPRIIDPMLRDWIAITLPA